MAHTYTVFQMSDGTFSATPDATFKKFYSDCTPIQSGVAGNQTRRMLRELTEKSRRVEKQSATQLHDTDSGLGIGGINNDQSMPISPSLRAMERVQKMHDTDIVCRRCGASKNFDGAMFTTLGGSSICDDCA